MSGRRAGRGWPLAPVRPHWKGPYSTSFLNPSDSGGSTGTDITEGLPFPLGPDIEGGASTSESWTNSGFAYDYAIAGLPFLSAASDRFPYRRQLAPVRKQQFDASANPGEQTFDTWWLRSQSAFDGGQGQRYAEPASDDAIMARYRSSYGVNPWTAGQVSLLRDTNLELAASGGSQVVGVGDYLYALAGGVVSRWSDTGSWTTITAITTTPTQIVSAGSRVLICHTQGIDVAATSGTTATALWTQATGTAPTAWWVKQRIIAAKANVLYELTLAGGVLTSETPLYTHPDSTWVWTSVTETPSAILAAGYGGNLSSIYGFTVSSTGTLPTLTSAVTVASLPAGEICHSLHGYLGYVGVGTSEGFRVALAGDGGQLQLGPLSVETDSPVRAVTASDRFMWFAADAAVNGQSGLWRVDLGVEDGGRYANAADIAGSGTGAVRTVATFAGTGRLAFTVDDVGVFVEDSARLVESGSLRTANIRYGTLEPKFFKGIRVQLDAVGGGVVVSTVDVDGDESQLAEIVSDLNEDVGVPLPAAEYAAFSFLLRRDPADPTSGAVLTGYQVRALPAVGRKEILRIPLLCFDSEMDRNHAKQSAVGGAITRYLALRDATADGNVVLVQNLVTGETLSGIVDDLDFQQVGPPKGQASGFGGVLFANVRTV